MDLGGLRQADYRYNALGQQVSRDVGGAVTLSVHDLAGNRIAEHDDTGAVLREYIWLDGRPLAVVEGGQTYWLHWDQIGRPAMATDSTGSVVWAASYLPFGGIDLVWADTGVLTQNLRFPGQWFQAETGLHQNWMRDYDPTTGRYLQADPLGLVDGPSVYGYVRQSPGRYVDPAGLWQFTFTIGVGPAAQITIGHNSGQWNAGVYLGYGIGISGSYVDADSGCDDPGYVLSIRAEGEVGLGAHIGAAAQVDLSRRSSSAEVSASVPGIPIAVGVSVKNGTLVAVINPTFSIGASAAVLVGISSTGSQ